MYSRYLSRIGKISLKLLLTVVLSVYFVAPAFAATIVPRGTGETAPQGKVLADSTALNLNEIALQFALDKQFIRIARGQSVSILGTLTLLFPDSVDIGNPLTTLGSAVGGWICSGSEIAIPGGVQGAFISDCLTGVNIGAINLNQMSSRCTTSSFSDIVGCKFVVESDYISSLTTKVTWTKGAPLSFRLDLDAGDLTNLKVNKSSATGELNTIEIFPSFRLRSPTVKNPTFLDLRKSFTIELYDTVAQLPPPGTPPPPGIGDNVAAIGTGQKSEQCKNAEGFVCALNLLVVGITELFREVVSNVIISYLGPFIETLVSIRTFEDKFAAVIYDAWQILRNLGNIFFILAIVAIGVATVFRISGYAVKDVLVKLITGAILINFSLTIAQAILGIADTAQNQFLGPNTGAIRAIVNPLVTTDIWKGVVAHLGEYTTSIQGIVAFWIIFAAFVALLGIAFLLFARVILLWILLMLSPIPYVAMVLPATRKFSHQWWSTFMKWAFMTPIIAFMLNLTATITEGNRDILQKLSVVQNGNSPESVSLMFNIAGMAIPIAFLYMTIKAATTFGKGTSSFIDRTLEKGASKAFLPAAFLGGAAAGAATKIGSAGVSVAKSPFVYGKERLSNKIGIEKAKLAHYIAPKPTDKGVWAATKGVAFNAVTGGELSAAKKKLREDNLAYAKSNVSRDARMRAYKDVPDRLKRAETEERNKEVKKYYDQIDGVDDTTETVKRIDGILAKTGPLSTDDQYMLEAALKKSIPDKTLKAIVDKHAAGEIANLYKLIQDKSGDEGKDLAVRLARMVNADAIPKGNLHFVVKADTPDNATAASVFRSQRVGGKSAEEIAQINTATYADIDKVSGRVKFKDLKGLGNLILAFKDPTQASYLASKLTPDQKKDIRTMYKADAARILNEVRTINGSDTVSYSEYDPVSRTTVTKTMKAQDNIDKFFTAI